jgi:subtilisin family serine protease
MKAGRCLAVLIALLFLAASDSVTSWQQPHVAADLREAVDESGWAVALVKLREDGLEELGLEKRIERIQTAQHSVLSQLSAQEFQLRYQYKTVPGFSGVLSKRGLAVLENNLEVESITMDAAVRGALLQSVPAIQADAVHNLGFTGEGVTVGVLDTGVDVNHPDLQNDIVYQYHFLNGGVDVGPGAQDLNGHGSNVTGIITSEGIVAPQGVAPKAKIVAIQILDRNSRGFTSDWVAGLDHITVNNESLHVKVINMSIVTDALYRDMNCDAQQTLMAAAANAAKNLGMVIFASSGNRGSTVSMGAPACLSGCTAVGAVYDSDLGREPNTGTYQSVFGSSWPACADAMASVQTVACFTNRNPKLEIVAPGVPITSAWIRGGVSTFTGTSQASPHAAAVAALMLQKDPSLTPDGIVSIMKNSSMQVFDSATGLRFPLLNALEALQHVAP